MTFAIAPMTAEHIPEFAALLDRWYARSRRPRHFPKPGESEASIAGLLAGRDSEAVVAHSRGRPVGYLVAVPHGPAAGRPEDHGHPRSALIAHGGHAVQAGQEPAALLAMYAAVSERLVARGYLVHHVDLPVDDGLAMAWFRLGFGLERVRGVMPVKATGRQPRRVEGMSIRRAGPADLAAVGRMAAESATYRRQAAMFQPQPEEVLAGLRTRYADALEDARCAAWLAVRRGEDAGLVLLAPSPPDPFTAEPATELAEAYVEPNARGEGVSRVLLATALAWAYDRGYRQVVTSWPTASPLAAGHWPAVGFRPVAHRLCRVLDPRITAAIR